MSGRVSRRGFLGMMAASAALQSADAHAADSAQKPNVLFIMTDQQRADAIGALGNPHIYTPNMDRLVARGVSFINGYSTCPVCVPARLTIRTGCEPPTTGCYANMRPDLVDGQPPDNEDRCGPYLARTMAGLGYRTFGIGKFHAHPWDADLGYHVHLHSEEMYGSPEHRGRDDYAAFIAKQHPAYDFVEALMGERTEMYYMPQMSPLPAHLGVEAWAADRAVELIKSNDARPWFGFVSFIGPHPPCAPPIPFNRMYDPDRMPNPIRGDKPVDQMDEYVQWMNYAIWADDITDSHARAVKARYYGEISYIDECLGRILDAVEARPDGANTLIAFFADHGDHLGDHGAWQKESYFDVACRVPFLVSWPAQLPGGTRREEIVCLTDLFGIATTAAGSPELREGSDVLGMLAGQAPARERLIGYYGVPGTNHFKVMVREAEWKHIYMANGGLEQLFNLKEDPHELRQRIADSPKVASRLRAAAIQAVQRPNANRALDTDGSLKKFPREQLKRQRIYQFDGSRGVKGFPDRPQDVVRPPKL